MQKIYSAFISSAFHSLRDERNKVIDTLLDFRILPIGMEHFTVSSSGEFSDIMELIDDSDFFILLLGEQYGSTDENGISWTEREYLYAQSKKKPIIAVICDELVQNLEKADEMLTEDQKRQVSFCNRIPFARKVGVGFGIKTIVSQFLHTYNFAKCTGWTRLDNAEEGVESWQQAHKAFDISGTWYQVHLSDDDESYIRIGTLKIEQDFRPNLYKNLHIEGHNFNIDYYDSQTQTMKENKMKSSKFVGEYTLQENGEIFGIFNATRGFKGKFIEQEIKQGKRRGIHDFTLDISSMEEETVYFDGDFHDEAPSPKLGRIFVFRDIDERNKFLLENREDVIEVR